MNGLKEYKVQNWRGGNVPRETKNKEEFLKITSYLCSTIKVFHVKHDMLILFKHNDIKTFKNKVFHVKPKAK